jgi:hypothetical protein
MQIVTGGDQGCGPDGFPYGSQEISFGVVHASDVYRSMHPQEDAIPGPLFLEPVQKFTPATFVKGLLHRAPRQGGGLDQRDELDVAVL